MLVIRVYCVYMQIILESERLLFRPHLITDLDAFCKMEMDINVRRYVGGYARTREKSEERFPKNQLEKMSTNQMALWATLLKAENTYIGRCGLAPHFNSNGESIAGEASLGYYIATKFWRQGFASEAAKAFIQFGFTELALKRIVATAEKGNDASIHILEKLGFSLECTEQGQRTFYHFTLQNPTKSVI